MTGNKKIRNATLSKSGDLTFKSKLEKMAYSCLLQHGFNPQYEPATFTLIDSFESKTPFYDKETDTQFQRRKEAGDNTPKQLVLKSNKIQGIRYTPDFYFNYNGLHVYIEMKGIENDVHYIKKKLFRRYLDSQPYKSIYFEIYTKKQLLQALKIIEEYGRGLTETNSTTSLEPSSEGHPLGKKVRGGKEF